MTSSPTEIRDYCKRKRKYCRGADEAGFVNEKPPKESNVLVDRTVQFVIGRARLVVDRT